jgi:hypothetical protein
MLMKVYPIWLYCFILKTDGKYYFLGLNYRGLNGINNIETGYENKWTEITINENIIKNHYFRVDTLNAGDNSQGHLGLGYSNTNYNLFTTITNVPRAIQFSIGNGFVIIHSIKGLYGSGNNAFGQHDLNVKTN